MEEIFQLKQQIIDTESEYPKFIVNSLTLPFGTFYWDDQDKDNIHFNHAVLNQAGVTDLKATLEQITRFYKDRGIQPRLFQPYTKGYFMEHADEFRVSGYDVQLYAPMQFMLLKEEPQKGSRPLEVLELKEWDERIAQDILIPDGNEASAQQLARLIGGERYKVYAGYLEDKAICVAIVLFGDHGVNRLSFAETVGEMRGKGYGQSLVAHLVAEHQKSGLGPLYTATDNRAAMRLFEKCGFVPVFEEELATAVYNKAE